MKKKFILGMIILFIIIIILLTTLYIIDNIRMKNNKPVIFGTWGNSYTPLIDENNIEIKDNFNPEETIKKPEYIDENKVKLGIYVDNGNNLELITTDYYCDWSPENIIGLFYAVPTQENSIPNANFDTMWRNYINEYSNANECRIGYSLEFTINDGSNIYYRILNPDDAYYTFPKIMSFLYDDVNLVPGKKYYHITQDLMYDYTICSSIKLVGDVDTYKIISDIKLTAFCFDSEDDFDEEGKYRGNSSYTINIKKY